MCNCNTCNRPKYRCIDPCGYCSQPTTNPTPCPTPCLTGCAEIYNLECVTYNGPDILVRNVFLIEKGMKLDAILTGLITQLNAIP